MAGSTGSGSLAGDALRAAASDHAGIGRELLLIAASALDGVDARRAVKNYLAKDRSLISDSNSPLVVLGIGKAAPGMAAGLSEALGGPLMTGVIVSDHIAEVPPETELIVGGHPLPTAGSLLAGRKLMEVASATTEDQPVVLLLSGGASALAEVPVPGVTLEGLRTTTELLLRSGAPIEAINAVRTSLSLIKGGGLAARISHRPLLTLAISDVGNRPAQTIGSGPTLPPTDEPSAAAEVLETYGLTGAIPKEIRDAVDRQRPRLRPIPESHRFVVVADADHAIRSASEAAEDRRLRVLAADADLEGEARLAARTFIRSNTDAGLVVGAGETTVTVTGQGTGGRNQEAALSAAEALDGVPDATFLALGTDGIDGPTDAAGGLVDGSTASAIRQTGVDLGESLATNDSYPALDAAGSLIRCGPTGTNIGDLWLFHRASG